MRRNNYGTDKHVKLGQGRGTDPFSDQFGNEYRVEKKWKNG